MALTITLNPETETQLRAQAQRQGQNLDHLVGQILNQAVVQDSLELDDPLPTNLYSPVAQLADAEVLELAALKMDALQNQRLGDLQAQGKAYGLTMAERYELFTLMQIYRLGLLRKSEALAEAHERGLAVSFSE